MSKQARPVWSAAIFSVAVLYGFWAASVQYLRDPGLHQGAGILISLVYLPLIFLIGMLVAGGVLGVVFKMITETTARAGLLLAALLVYVIGSGKPSLTGLILALLAFPFGYFFSQKASKDQQDLDKFMEK